MNNKLLSFAAAAATLLAFAACNKVDVQSPDVTNMETAYAKVKISMGNVGTRSFGSGEEATHNFDQGTQDEARINNLTVLLYDANQVLVGVGSSNGFTTPDEDRDAGTSVSDAYKATVIPVKITPGSAEPVKLLALVNTDASFENLTAAAANKTASFGESKNFVMTNAGYYSGNEWTTAVDCTNAVYDTNSEAEAAEAIEIYVERKAAKVTVKENPGMSTTSNAKIIGVDGTEYQIEFLPYRWAATGTARESYTLKQAFDTKLNTWANDATRKRSYWAQGVLFDEPYAKYTQSPRLLKYLTANQIVSNKGVGLAFGNDPFYVHEHTLSNDVVGNEKFNAVMAATNAIVVGQYKVIEKEGHKEAEKFQVKIQETQEGGAQQEVTAYDFYLAMTATDYIIYSEADLVKRLFEFSDVEVSTVQNDEEKANLITIDEAPEYFTVQKSSSNSNQYRLKLKEGKTLYIGGDLLDNDTIETQLTGASNAKHYLNGWAYFFAPIMHNNGCGDENDPAEGLYGIVRNHSYQLTVMEITGLGAPLDEGQIGEDPKGTNPKDPDDPDPDPEDPGDNPIEPDPDETRDAYINAALKVLSWHVVDQEVHL